MKDLSTPGPWHVGGVFNPNSEHPRANVWGPVPPGMQSGNIVCFEARLHDAELIAAAPMMLDALAKVYRALMSDPPHGPQKHVGPDDVIYCLDGQLMYHAINAARDALALVRASMRESEGIK